MGSVKRLLVSALGVSGMALVAAQSAPAQDGGETSAFEIPADVNLLGEMDPNNRRATAKVNGEVITGTDIDHRMALVIDANQGVEIPPEEMQRLRLQVVRNLIDETLQIQEAAAQDMAVTDQEVNEYYERYATQGFGRTPAELEAYLVTIGSSSASLKRQIRGELAWSRLVQRNVQPFVNVSADEVNEMYQRLQDAKGTPEYRIAEIYLSSTPTTHAAVRQNAQRIVDQLREGGNFQAYARQFSEASTAAVGGDLGWIKLEQLQNPTLEAAARQMQPGHLVGPIEIPGGYSILLLVDSRQVGMPDPRDAVLSLMQISLDFPPGIGEDEARTRAAAFAQGVQQIPGCGAAESAAAALGATVVSNDEIPVRALPDTLQQAMLQLNVGEVTPPFGSLEEGIRVLMLCGRDDPEVESGPNYEQIMAQLEDDRIDKRAQRYLRDLRRDAVVEYN